MIEKKTVIDQIEITRSGHIQIRFGLLIVEDGVEISCQWHRTNVEPGGDIDAQIAAVSDHLVAMGKALPDQDRISELKAIAAIVHTPERVIVFQEQLEAQGRIDAQPQHRPAR